MTRQKPEGAKLPEDKKDLFDSSLKRLCLMEHGININRAWQKRGGDINKAFSTFDAMWATMCNFAQAEPAEAINSRHLWDLFLTLKVPLWVHGSCRGGNRQAILDSLRPSGPVLFAPIYEICPCPVILHWDCQRCVLQMKVEGRVRYLFSEAVSFVLDPFGAQA